jgi:hypothetical protein
MTLAFDQEHPVPQSTGDLGQDGSGKASADDGYVVGGDVGRVKIQGVRAAVLGRFQFPDAGFQT